MPGGVIECFGHETAFYQPLCLTLTAAGMPVVGAAAVAIKTLCASSSNPSWTPCLANGRNRPGALRITDLLKDLGVESPDKLKEALKRLSIIEEQGKTDTQKLTDQVAALQKQLDTEKATAAEQVKAATLRLMQAEVVTEAAKQGVRADAVADVWVFVDKDKITEKEGKFEGVKEAVEAVVKAKAYLLDQKKQGNGQGTPDRSKQGGQTQQNQGGDQNKAKTRPITL